jgi:hypothetical protein
VVDHRVNAGHGHGHGVVDVNDTGMGVWAPQHLGVQQASDVDIVDESRVTLHQLESVDLYYRLTDHRGSRDRFGWHEPWNRQGCVDRGSIGVDLDWVGSVGEWFDDLGLEQIDRFAGHSEGCTEDRLHGLHIGRFPVDYPGESIADLSLGRIGIAIEQLLSRQHHRGGRVAGLDGPGSCELSLDGVHSLTLGEAFDGEDRLAF